MKHFNVHFRYKLLINDIYLHSLSKQKSVPQIKKMKFERIIIYQNVFIVPYRYSNSHHKLFIKLNMGFFLCL